MTNVTLLKNVFFITLFTMLLSTSAFAAFPVSNNSSSEATVVEESVATSGFSDGDRSYYNMWIAAALWLVAGGLAAHRWYARKPIGWNILFILTFGGLFIWALVDIINILMEKF